MKVEKVMVIGAAKWAQGLLRFVLKQAIRFI